MDLMIVLIFCLTFYYSVNRICDVFETKYNKNNDENNKE